MFEMKNESINGFNKRRNEDFLKGPSKLIDFSITSKASAMDNCGKPS